MDKGHWIFEQDFDVNEWFGFIYRIIEISTGKEYIGKKQFFQHLRKPVKGKIRRKRVKRESDWRTYTSSSEHVNKAIVENGMSNYKFIIESLHKTKGSLHYAEVRTQVNEDVLRAKLDDGITPKYFNKQIAGVKFIPPEEISDEARMKISTTLIEKYKVDPHWRSTLTEDEIKILNDKFYSGKQHYLYRIMSENEREEFIKTNYDGENNPMFGKTHPNNGRTYYEIHGEESPYKGMSYVERYGEERASIILESQRKNRPDVSGNNNAFYGKTHTDEQKAKWKNDPRRIKIGNDNGMTGKSVTDFMSEEKIKSWKESISKSTKGVPKKKVTCPHCSKMGAPHLMSRFHFENCKNLK